MFIELEVKTAIIIHGYDAQNKEIKELLNEDDFMKKIISIERIKSISEKYLLVTSSHDRLMYWEYKETMKQVKQKLINIAIPIA